VKLEIPIMKACIPHYEVVISFNTSIYGVLRLICNISDMNFSLMFHITFKYDIVTITFHNIFSYLIVNISHIIYVT